MERAQRNKVKWWFGNTAQLEKIHPKWIKAKKKIGLLIPSMPLASVQKGKPPFILPFHVVVPEQKGIKTMKDERNPINCHWKREAMMNEGMPPDMASLTSSYKRHI